MPLKLRRKTSKKRINKNKRKLGKSIEERLEEIETRKAFGNWEIDTVIPKKNKEESALISITKRKTRMEIILKIESKTSFSVNKSLEKLLSKLEGSKSIFKGITSDKGVEFSSLTKVEKIS